MNTYKAMGIQQWRLKSSFTNAGSSNGSNEAAEADQTIIENPADSSPVLVSSLSENLDQPKGNEASIDRASADSMLDSANQIEIATDLSAEPIDGAVMGLDWQALQATIDSKEHCPSCGQGNTVLGSGNANATWMFVIDAPTSREVAEQLLCVGRAGELYEAMLRALGLSREEVYISSIFKCAPTADLSVTPQCNNLIARQIELVSPKAIVTFGEFSAQAIIKANDSLESLRAGAQQCARTKVALVPTYSPVQMLNDLSLKARVWEDLKKAVEVVNR